MEKNLEPRPSPSNCSKDSRKLLHLLIPINWPSFVTSWVVVQKIYLKMYLVSCTLTHPNVTDSVNHRMVKNTKTCISWERNIFFLWNKHFFNLCLRWHILKSYHFVAEVTFNIHATIACRFTLKRVRDMIITYNKMHCTVKYSQQSSVLGQFG